ncbi:endoplasmic reticulum-Golgi intermediate compartment protein 3-like isoform X5 [Gossypium australe]|uniref:Endoplasmic reticulum-Golgi intermediate compartment protein 3-like isoform X5 n=1 Tax=Gossypium australe TaxID=47621 RepID=A0A5B6V635_9ROSI|nr:endoplasmic reticulum-Golgi intermediate compartment protein 3-like isoform X5 [Gossypium australe]
MEKWKEIDKKEEDGPEANYKKPGCVSSYGGTFVAEDAIGSTCLDCWFSDNGHAVYSRAYVLPNNIRRSRGLHFFSNFHQFCYLFL